MKVNIQPIKNAPEGAIFGTCLFDPMILPNKLMVQVFLDYFFFETVRKPLRGFSLTMLPAGRSTGVPFAFFSTFAKK